jgi:hypothetical protein
MMPQPFQGSGSVNTPMYGRWLLLSESNVEFRKCRDGQLFDAGQESRSLIDSTKEVCGILTDVMLQDTDEIWSNLE